MSRFMSMLIFALLLSLTLAACGDPTPIPGPKPTPLPIPTQTPKPSPTPLIGIPTDQWGVVKFPGAEVKETPADLSKTLEKVNGYTVFQIDLKLQDDTWFRRSGGGWINGKDLNVYLNEFQAKRSIPTPGVNSTPSKP